MSEQNPEGADPESGAPASDEPTRLPDDHPLVTAYATLKAQNRDLKTKAQEQAAGSRTNEDRIADLEKRTATAERAALVSRAQAKHGISDADAELYLTATDPDALERQAAGLAARSDGKRKTNPVPNEGKTPKTSDDPERTAVRNLFGKGD